MDILDFARGPGLKIAIGIFCFGVVWRIAGIALLRIRPDRNTPRNGMLKSMMIGVIATGGRSWPHREFMPRTGAGEALGYSYHMGLFAIMLASGPHVAFLGSLVGFTWPTLPNSVVTIIAVLTFTLLLAVLFRRITHPVIRMLSNFDDYFSWFITALVIVTGLMATAHVGGPYQTVLGVHILSFDLLLVWFPFGKLMHAFYIFPSRAVNAYLMARKGAAV